MSEWEMLAGSPSRDFVALMDCTAGDDWLPTARSQIESWLREKDVDIDLSVWADYDFQGKRLSVRPMPHDRGADLAVRLTEDAGTLGKWTSEIFLHDERGDRDWIQISVRNDQGRFVKVPRLARYVMQVLPLSDGRIEFSDRPQTLGERDVGRLLELLADEGRHGPVFVAGTRQLELPFEPFVKKVGQWSREVHGLAQIIVLDPAATAAFEAKVGPRFAVPAWTIRTFQPGVRVDDPLDARRHRILGTSRLASQKDGAIAVLLGEIARQLSATRTPDPGVLRVRRRLTRLENSRLVEAVTAAPQEQVEALTQDVLQSPTASDDRTKLDLVRQILRIKDVTEEALRSIVDRLSGSERERNALAALRARVDALQSTVEGAEDDRLLLSEALDESQLEAEVARLDVESRDAKIRWLESRLKDVGDYDSQYGEIPDEFLETRPGSFSELLDRLEECPTVSFTGDAGEVEQLNQIDTNDAALRTAWDAVLALMDYVRARANGDCDKGLGHYISHTPAGYVTFPPGKYGDTETGATMRSFGDERSFPVPAEVDSSGTVTMKAHFKLARIGMVSPRMYVYDGHPSTPHIFIGYIGTHLTNTKTR